MPPRSEPMRRTGQLERRTRLSPVSEVRAAARDVEAEVRAEVFARDGRCLLDHLPTVAGMCFGRATFHHLQKASAGGDYTVENGVCLCARHNGWVEDWPVMGYRFGLVVGYDRAAGVPVDHVTALSRRLVHGLTPRKPRTRGT